MASKKLKKNKNKNNCFVCSSKAFIEVKKFPICVNCYNKVVRGEISFSEVKKMRKKYLDG